MAPVAELEPPLLGAAGGDAAPERGPTLEARVLGALADPESSPCPVCGGVLERFEGGARCLACGSELARGQSARGAWV